MAFTTAWNAGFEASPAGSDDSRTIDDRMRELKEAVRERAEVFCDADVTSDTWELKPRTVASAGARPGSPVTNQMVYRSDLEAWQRYDGSAWKTAGRVVNIIEMWAGNPGSVPNGWALCDGSTVNSIVTPDLSGRFIVSYDAANAAYDSTDPIGSPDKDGYTSRGDSNNLSGITLLETHLPAHTHTGTTDTAPHAGGTHLSAGSNAATAQGDVPHTHTFETDETGGDTAHENRPPYFMLAFIMYVGGE